PDLVRAMCEANAAQLVPVLDHAMLLLGEARDQLAADQPVTALVEAGHAARIRYDGYSRPQIIATVVGAEGWRDELAAAGRAGGVIRSALPTRGSPG
ncbi:MAG: prephenate dehydrogenase, partial [Mycobacterium sp.]